MRVVYWTKLQLARQQVLDALRAVPEAESDRGRDACRLLGALKGAEALVLYDAPPEEARQIVDVCRRPATPCAGCISSPRVAKVSKRSDCPRVLRSRRRPDAWRRPWPNMP